jgi:hypothetical protein
MPGTEFNVSGPCSTFNLVQTKLGAQLNLTNQLILFSDFQGEFSKVSQSYSGKAGLKYWWWIYCPFNSATEKIRWPLCWLLADLTLQSICPFIGAISFGLVVTLFGRGLIGLFRWGGDAGRNYSEEARLPFSLDASLRLCLDCG